jgi:hypothetical protein
MNVRQAMYLADAREIMHMIIHFDVEFYSHRASCRSTAQTPLNAGTEFHP